MFRPVSAEIEPSSTRSALASTIGLAATAISSSASMISPSPISTRPKCPTGLPLRDRCRITPKKISNGDSHDRSSANTCAISAVPTLAPSRIANADDTPISPCATNAPTMVAVALLLCTRHVTPTPASSAESRFDTLRDSSRRRSAPYRRSMPTLTVCVPQTSRATPESSLSSVYIESCLASDFLLGERDPQPQPDENAAAHAIQP